jgi:replicative DNA helicase
MDEKIRRRLKETSNSLSIHKATAPAQIEDAFNFDVNNLEATPSQQISQYTIMLAQYLITLQARFNTARVIASQKRKVLDRRVKSLLQTGEVKGSTLKEREANAIASSAELQTLELECDEATAERDLLDDIDKPITELINAFKSELTEQIKSEFAHAGNEAAVLACIFRDVTNYFEAEAKLSDQDFLTPRHRALWTIIKTLMRADVTVLDLASVMNQASVLKIEDNIGGYEYVSSLFEKSVDPSNILFYIGRVADASTKYQIIQAVDEISYLTERNKTLTGETLTAADLVDFSQDKFLEIAVNSERGTEAENLADGLEEMLEEAITNPSAVRGLSTGFERLDEAINGLEPGTLTVLGARPKVGKSTFLLNTAINIACHVRVPVLYIDTEMGIREQRMRLVSILSGVAERDIKNGTFYNDEIDRERVAEAIRIAERGMILHKYYPDFSAEAVSSVTRKYHHQYGVGCLIFDYIKLPDSDLQHRENVQEHQALGYLCVALKNLAGQLGIPVFTAAQIGRQGANKGHVTASEFADSDRILRYANTLLGLSQKTKKEFRELEEEFGSDQVIKMGSHRLQILDTRAGGTNFAGFDINFRKKVLTMKEADVQITELRPVGIEEE